MTAANRRISNTAWTIEPITAPTTNRAMIPPMIQGHRLGGRSSSSDIFGLHRCSERRRQPLVELLLEDLPAAGQRVAVAREADDLSRPGDHPDHLARLHWEDLVALAVEQDQRATGQAARHLAPGRLGGERGDPGDQVAQPDADTHSDGPTEAVTHRHHPLSTL